MTSQDLSIMMWPSFSPGMGQCYCIQIASKIAISLIFICISRENICRHPTSPGENCDTLGLAELGTMCNKHSCAIVQDNGLSAAFTVAHELGHV